MAIKIIKEVSTDLEGTKYVTKNRSEIIMDSQADVSSLPTIQTVLPGSIAYTADAAHVYMLSPSGVWTEVQ